MRLLIPMAGALLALAACGSNDSPFLISPSPTASGPTQTPAAATATATPSDCQPTDYEVRDGDTLAGLAETFDVTIEAIIEASDLEDPDVLAIGDPLKIPCPTEAPQESPTETPEATPDNSA
jgi:LysM repeat protein